MRARLIAAMLAFLAGISASHAQVTTQEAQQMAQAVSAWRQANGLPAVRVDATLNKVSAQQTAAMIQINALSHDAAGDFRTRVRAAGVRGAVAENLAYGTATVADTLALWKSSAQHNANMLTPEYRRIGLARGAAASGQTYWTLTLAQ